MGDMRRPGTDVPPLGGVRGTKGSPGARRPLLYAYRIIVFQRDAQQRALGSVGS